ncbi:hypothetical protein Q7P36_004626 [Cladosporium allicinum]
MALALLITILAVQTVFSQQDIPFCLQTCLTEVGTNLCATHALHDLTPCLAKTCANPPATENLIASLDVAFSPKAEYSCQQAYGPSSSNTEASSVTLPLNGTCATSPYEFKSYLPQSVSSIRASVGCGIITFSDEDCLGEAGSSDVGTLSDGKCVFRGGRSARLTCRNELDAARAYMQTNCGTDGGDADGAGTSSSSSSKTIYPSSAPFHGPGPTSFGTGTSTSIPFHWPFSSDSDSAAATSSMPSTTSSIPFHWPFSSSSGSLTASASSPSTTNTADAVGSSNATSNSTAITYSPTLTASASASPSGNGSASTGGTANGNDTSPSSGPLNATYTLSMTPTVDPTTLPTFAGLASQFGSGSKGAAAIALVAAGFALFL